MNQKNYKSVTIEVNATTKAFISEHDYGFSGLPSVVVHDNTTPDVDLSIVYVPPQMTNGATSHFEITCYENGKARVYNMDLTRLIPAVLVLYIPSTATNYNALMQILKEFVDVVIKAFPDAAKTLGSDL